MSDIQKTKRVATAAAKFEVICSGGGSKSQVNIDDSRQDEDFGGCGHKPPVC